MKNIYFVISKQADITKKSETISISYPAEEGDINSDIPVERDEEGIQNVIKVQPEENSEIEQQDETKPNVLEKNKSKNGKKKRTAKTIKTAKKKVTTKSIPIKQIYGMVIMTNFTMTSQLASLMKEEQVPIVFTDSNGKPRGSFRPFGRSTGKTLLQFYKMIQFDPERRLLLCKSIANTAITNKYRALLVSDEQERETINKKISQFKKELESIHEISEIKTKIGQYRETADGYIKRYLDLKFLGYSEKIQQFVRGMMYGVLECAVFHTQLDPRFGILNTENDHDSLPLIDDLFVLFGGTYLDFFLMNLDIDIQQFPMTTPNEFPESLKRHVANKYLEFMEKTHYIKSLKRSVRLLEVPKLQLYRWIKFANELSDSTESIPTHQIIK